MIMTRKVRANKRSRRGGISLLWDFQVSGGPRSRRGGGIHLCHPLGFPQGVVDEEVAGRMGRGGVIV